MFQDHLPPIEESPLRRAYHRVIGALVIASTSALTVFVFQWLSTH